MKGVSSGSVGVSVSRSGIIRPGFVTLSRLREGLVEIKSYSEVSRIDGWAHWLCRTPVPAAESSCSRSDLRLLLGVLDAPLAPVHINNNEPLPHLFIKDTPIEEIKNLMQECDLNLDGELNREEFAKFIRRD